MRRRITRRPIRTTLTAALAAGLSLVLSACGGADPAASAPSGTTAVQVGVIPILDVAPIYLGIQKGFFSDAKLDLTLQTAQGGAAIVPGVVSGQYQFGFSNTTSLLLATSKGLPLKVVSAGVSSTGTDGKDFGAVVVRADSPIKTTADLVGKKVAVNTLNNINTTTIDAVVRGAGADPTSIAFTELAFPDIAPAVARGDVEAGQLVEPFLTIALQQGDRQVVSNYAGTDPRLVVGMYFTSQSYAQTNPAVVNAFATAMKKSLTYAQEHPDEARAILSSYLKIDPAVQKAMNLPRWTPDLDTASVQKLADLSKQEGLITTTPDLTALLP